MADLSKITCIEDLRVIAQKRVPRMFYDYADSGSYTQGTYRDLEGLTPELIAKLAEGGVHTRDDLADLGVDELTDLTGQSEDDAKALIMKAREHWFAGQQE